MSLTDDSKAVLALTTRLGNARRPSLPPTRWHELSAVLVENGLTPADLFDPGLEVEDLPGIRPETASSIRGLLLDASAATVAAGEFGRKGIWTLTIADDDYPRSLVDRLGRTTPPVIFGAGDRSLLTGEGIAIVGSRNVVAEGGEAAQEVAAAAVTLSRPVVSGGARGVDQLAMNAAYQAGGMVIGVLADSLQGRIRNSDILRALDAGTTCLITQQTPAAGFSAGAALSRNKLVYALSALTVVIATDEGSGGTWAGATEAIKGSNGIVTVWRGDGEGPGNAALEQLGALPMRSIDELVSLLDGEKRDQGAPTEDPVQLGLLDST
ncbi:MAG: DNA-processing protein DprA [Actinomycetota bacterium]|nr:DNA-processing protein DprA [Actinomycetota bacterium]